MFDQKELDILTHWILERDKIRQLKESGATKPWTEDSLLQQYRFCNVKRMDDKVSRWLLKHWYPKTMRTGSELYSAVLARAINWPDALECIIGSLDSVERTITILKQRKNEGQKVFTGAYVVPGVKGQDKIDSIIGLGERVRNQSKTATNKLTMRDTWKWLLTFKGLGTFLSGQIAADLACLPYGSLWQDRFDWAPVGPGSARGMNRLLGIKKTATVSQERFEPLLLELIKKAKPAISEIWEDRQLCAMDIQNCLCEFDKYRRLTLREGNVRAKYPGLNGSHEGEGTPEQLKLCMFDTAK